MKFFVIASFIFVAAMGQRSPYAGTGPKGLPDLASRFRDPSESTTVKLYNRFAEDGTTIRIPVDARGDGELVDRLSQWPKEHQPFWLLNADHIEAHRSQPPTQPPQQQNVNLNSRSSFDNNQETIPVRPNQPRSSFLGPLN